MRVGNMAESNMRWVSVFYFMESRGMTSGMSHQRCGNSWNNDFLQEIGRTSLTLWPLAALDSKECTRTGSQMPDFFIILQGLKMRGSHYFISFRLLLSVFKSLSFLGSSHCGSVELNPTNIHEDVGSIPGLAQWFGDPALP